MRPVKNLALGPQPGAKVNILEPGRDKARIKASDLPKDSGSHGESRAGGLFDRKRNRAPRIGITGPPSRRIVRGEVVEKEEFPQVPSKGWKSAKLKRELVLAIGWGQRSNLNGFPIRLRQTGRKRNCLGILVETAGN
jgi:hypothetical protein